MLKHKGTQRIEMPRLVLRRFEPADARQVYDNWASDPEVCRYMRFAPYTSVEQAAEMVDKWIARCSEADRYHWAITLKPDMAVIGSISLSVANETDELGEMGYCLGRRYWGGGLMTEAVKAVIAFGFEQVGFNRIEACHSINNPASGRVMQKAGMLQEGLLRQSYKCALGFQDTYIYGILRQDYDAAK